MKIIAGSRGGGATTMAAVSTILLNLIILKHCNFCII